MTSIGLDEKVATTPDRTRWLPPPSPPLPAPLDQPTAEIASLPPLKTADEIGYPRSLHTGEPRRPRTLLVSIVLSWLSVAATCGGFAQWWWQASSVTGFHPSARILDWTKPDPPSILAVVMVIVVALIAILMAAAGGVTAYNTWAGNSWIRVGGLICLALTGVSFLLNLWFSIAMIPLGLGVVLVWLPPAQKFFTAMTEFRAVKPVVVPTTGIRYGPQPLIGRRD